jgi:tRNA isopentenyl-2-thiomethyl-A-37 hydroxylase MiaE
VAKHIKTEDLDRLFDEGGDISAYIDADSIKRINAAVQRVNLDLPTHVVDRLDAEARKIGVPRQSLIKVWLAERLGISPPPVN